MKSNRGNVSLVLLVVGSVAVMSWLVARGADATGGMKRWKANQGWGWVWGEEDELGSLNEMTDESRLAAVGKKYC